jgi:hypothetical protein
MRLKSLLLCSQDPATGPYLEPHTSRSQLSSLRGYIQKFPDWVNNEINNNKNKRTLRSNIKGYGGKTHYTDSQTSDTTAPSGRQLYHLQFSLQAASLETFGYTLVFPWDPF